MRVLSGWNEVSWRLVSCDWHAAGQIVLTCWPCFLYVTANKQATFVEHPATRRTFAGALCWGLVTFSHSGCMFAYMQFCFMTYPPACLSLCVHYMQAWSNVAMSGAQNGWLLPAGSSPRQLLDPGGHKSSIMT
jgi:hypothetical protein